MAAFRFDLAAGPDNLVENRPYKYIFSTEGRILLATPQIALIHEHCSYFGAFCKESETRNTSFSSISEEAGEYNGTSFQSIWGSSRQSIPMHGLIKGLCPGPTHGQKVGISYLGETEATHGEVSVQQEESGGTLTDSVVVVSNSDVLHRSENDSDIQESSQKKTESDTSQIER